MNEVSREKFVGNICVGDKLNLLPHRLLQLGQNKIAVISENNSGWCVTDIDNYAHIKEFFSQQEIIFDESLGNKKISLINSLWDFNLLEKNGTHLGKIIQPFAPVLLVLKITGNCNFNCSYCYDYSENRVSKTISIDKVKETILFILLKNRGMNLVFHGGEPLLHFSLIKEIVEFAAEAATNKKHINFLIQTNGSMFNKEIITFLDKYNFGVGLSLDGMSETTNAHRTVKSGASCLEIFNKNIKEYGDFLRRRSGVVCTLSKRNLEDFPNFTLWLQDLGFRGVTLSPLSIAGKGINVINDLVSPEEYIKLLTILINMVKSKKIHISVDSINKFVSSLVQLRPSDLCHANPCGAGDNFLVIDATGNYRTCDCFYHDYFLLDNNDINLALDKRSKILDRVEHMKNHDCSNCAIFGFCGGGCTSEAIARNGIDKTIPELSCKVKKFFYELLLKEFAFDKERPLFAYYARCSKSRDPRVKPEDDTQERARG